MESPKSVTSHEKNISKNRTSLSKSNNPINTIQTNNINNPNLPHYFNLYPPVSENDINLLEKVPFIQWDFTKQRHNNKNKENIKLNSASKESFLEDSINNDAIFEMNEPFLESLLQRKSNFDKNKTINTICNFIRNSKLLQKIESEYTSEKKIDSENLVLNCAKSLGYVKLQKGEVLFKIGDVGDKFYFILSGKISILKLSEIKDIPMTYVEYLQYCIFLWDNKEEYILNEVFKKNNKVLDIENIEDIIKIYRIIFINSLREKILNHMITRNNDLFKFFAEYKQSLSSFHLNENDLIKFEENPNKKVDWENYILKHVRLSLKENIFFEDYEDTFKNKNQKNNITCFIYEPFLYFGPGLFFGDFALDSENAKRNATIRAEEKTFLAWMKSVDYANIIAPRRKIEKHYEIMFLYKNFFFKNTNVFTFEKKYFHLFPPREFLKNDNILIQNDKKNGLFFIKNGMIQMTLNISIFELQNLIRKIYEKMVKNKYFKKITAYKGTNYLINEDTLKRLKKNLHDPILFNLKDKKSRLVSELNKKINYKLTIITQNELIGIEEIFLNLNNICSGVVISDKLVGYELSEKQLNIFLEEEKNIVFLYTKYAINKIVTMLDRLQNLKNNRIYIMKTKFENNNLNEEKNGTNDNEKNNNENIFINSNVTNDGIKNLNENYDSDDKNLKSCRLENGIKSPLSQRVKLNIKKILQEKSSQKTSNIKKDRIFISSTIKNNKFANEKKLFQNKKKMSFFKDMNEDRKKNNSSSNTNIYRYYIPENSNKDENFYLIGNIQIPVHQIKQEIKDNNYLNFNNNNLNTNINNDNISQIFEFSKLKYPLSERLHPNKKSEKKNSNENSNSMTLYKNTESNNNNNIMTEKNFYKRKINVSQSQKFYGKIKKVIKVNKISVSNDSKEKKKKINMINLSQNQLIKKYKKKIINKKQLLPGIIKDFDKKMKKFFFNNSISKKNKEIKKVNSTIINNNDSYRNKIYENIKIKRKNELRGFLPKIDDIDKVIHSYKAII